MAATLPPALLAAGKVLNLSNPFATNPADAQLLLALLHWTTAGLAVPVSLLALRCFRHARTAEALFLVVGFPWLGILNCLAVANLLGPTDAPTVTAIGWSVRWLATLTLALAIGGGPVANRDGLARRILVFGLVGGSVLLSTLSGMAVLGGPLFLPHTTSLWDLFALLALGFATLLLWTSLPSERSLPFLLGVLLVAALPQALSLILSLLPKAPPDSHFLLSGWINLWVSAVLTGGLLLERRQQARNQQQVEQLAHEQLQTTTAELERVDRKLVEQESSLRMLEKAVETMSIGVTITDRHGKILYVNPADAQMHGYEAGELLGADARIFAADPGVSAVALPENQAWTRERVNITRSGRSFPVRLISDQVRNPSGELIATVTICEDISERQQIQQALERRDRILEAVGLAAERLLGDHPWEGNFDDVLERLGQATGVDRVYMNLEYESRSAEGVTRSWAPPDGNLDETAGVVRLPPRSGLFLRWRDRLQHGETLHGPVQLLPQDERRILETRGVRSFAAVPIFVRSEWHGYLSLEDCDAHRHWSSAELEALKIAAGTLGAAIQRKQTNSALAASEAKFRDLLESANDLIQSVSPEGHFLFVNRAWRETLGYTEEEVLELRFLDIVRPDYHEHCQQVLRYILTAGTLGRVVVAFVARDGREILVEGSLNCRYEEGKAVATRGIFRDISERQVVDRMKQEFISMVSHELRTPLTSIIASLGLLNSGKLQDKPARVQELLGVAYRNSNRLLQMINDLLDVQKLAANKMSFSLEAISLAPLLSEVLGSVQSFADAQSVRLLLDEDIGASLRVRSDRHRLHQVLHHLLANAIKFSPAGGAVNLGAKPDGQRIQIAVQDQGKGIPEDFHGRLFDQFTQVDSSTTRPHGGSGLGLSIVRGLVEGMGGQVAVTSQVGQGTTFFVDLPAA